MAKATTVRFTNEMFARLDQASARTGMPVNSIVIAACLEWMERHTPPPEAGQAPDLPLEALRARAMPGPRWATISRAMRQVVSHGRPSATYPFDRFTDPAKQMLQLAQSEAQKAGRP